MKVKDLIQELSRCDQDMEVFAWLDGSRYPIQGTDSNMNDCVDLNVEYESSNPLKDAFPYALGYWQGRACGYFENGTYENMSEYHKHLYKTGYESGVADYAELDLEKSHV